MEHTPLTKAQHKRARNWSLLAMALAGPILVLLAPVYGGELPHAPEHAPTVTHSPIPEDDPRYAGLRSSEDARISTHPGMSREMHR